MSAEKHSVVVNFGSSEHPSGGLRFGSQPREDESEGEQRQIAEEAQPVKQSE